MFNKNVKTTMIIAMLLIMGLGSLVLNADCRMMAMSAHRGKDLTSINNNNNFLTACLEELQDQGGSVNCNYYNNYDGWGLIYYLDGNMLQDGIFRGTEQAYGSQNYDDAQTIIEDAYAHLTMGHVRRASSNSVTDIDNPHPFIFHTVNADYAFIHNGSVDIDDFVSLMDGLDEAWLDEHPLTEHQQYPHYVDSEALFLWIMQNIELNDYNIFEGLIDAIKGMGALNGEDRTFILTDGIDLYCYKNSTDAELNHDLYYTWMTAEDDLGFWTVMSLFPDSSPSIQAMVNDELLYLSPTGHQVSIMNCSNQNGEIQHNRQLFAGWNWEAFPVFPITTDNGADILDYLETHGEITEVEGLSISNPIFTGEDWIPSYFQFDDKSLYKLNMTTYTNPVHYGSWFNTVGIMRDTSQPILEDIEGYQYYWIGYDLMPSQRIDDAFGDEWSNVRTIKGEDWSYYRGVEPNDPPMTRGCLFTPLGKYLEFGKGYIVSFYNDLSSFNWNYRHENQNDIPHSKKAETFVFEEKADYLSMSSF